MTDSVPARTDLRLWKLRGDGKGRQVWEFLDKDGTGTPQTVIERYHLGLDYVRIACSSN